MVFIKRIKINDMSMMPKTTESVTNFIQDIIENHVDDEIATMQNFTGYIQEPLQQISQISLDDITAAPEVRDIVLNNLQSRDEADWLNDFTNWSNGIVDSIESGLSGIGNSAVDGLSGLGDGIGDIAKKVRDETSQQWEKSKKGIDSGIDSIKNLDFDTGLASMVESAQGLYQGMFNELNTIAVETGALLTNSLGCDDTNPYDTNFLDTILNKIDDYADKVNYLANKLADTVDSTIDKIKSAIDMAENWGDKLYDILKSGITYPLPECAKEVYNTTEEYVKKVNDMVKFKKTANALAEFKLTKANLLEDLMDKVINKLRDSPQIGCWMKTNPDTYKRTINTLLNAKNTIRRMRETIKPRKLT